MLDTSKWKEFELVSLFQSYERGKRLTEYNRDPGDIPLVTAGFQNEGVADFISNAEQKRYCNKITIDMFCNVFYRDYEFCCDDNIIVLINDNLSTNVCLFITTVIKKDKFRFAYGRQYRQKDLLKHKIKLPVDSDGNPDWTYMEKYIEELQTRERERAALLLRIR
ncbi:MAG: restriction endonuclease subunit S [Bacilli bacterium]|nr:restriction endonuclease subunit S [Bacilli bacterium]